MNMLLKMWKAFCYHLWYVHGNGYEIQRERSYYQELTRRWVSDTLRLSNELRLLNRAYRRRLRQIKKLQEMLNDRR